MVIEADDNSENEDELLPDPEVAIEPSPSNDAGDDPSNAPDANPDYRTEPGDDPASSKPTGARVTRFRNTQSFKSAAHAKIQKRAVERTMERKRRLGRNVTSKSHIGRSYAETHPEESEPDFGAQGDGFNGQSSQQGRGMGGGGAGGRGGGDNTETNRLLTAILEALKLQTQEIQKLTGIGTYGA
jgi:hypothetical protein